MFMSFKPRIEVTIANNRCNCCEDSSIKPQPKEMAVFYKDGKFYAKLDRDDFSVIYKGLIQKTNVAIQEFLAQQYSVTPLEIPEGYRVILMKRLPSLEEVYEIEKAAGKILSSKSDPSLDGSNPGSPHPVRAEERFTPSAESRKQ